MAKVGIERAIDFGVCGSLLSLSLSLSLSLLHAHTAWLEHSPGSLETAASQCVCSLDGWEHNLSLPHHDGRDDASETSADTIWI